MLLISKVIDQIFYFWLLESGDAPTNRFFPIYYSTYNFVGARVDGYEQPMALMTKQAADSLKVVSDELREQGYRIKIWDSYRPQTAVNHFVRWAENLQDTTMKQIFYPMVDKSLLFEQQYIMARSGHSRGSTVDLTLVSRWRICSKNNIEAASPGDSHHIGARRQKY